MYAWPDGGARRFPSNQQISRDTRYVTMQPSLLYILTVRSLTRGALQAPPRLGTARRQCVVHRGGQLPRPLRQPEPQDPPVRVEELGTEAEAHEGGPGDDDRGDVFRKVDAEGTDGAHVRISTLSAPQLRDTGRSQLSIASAPWLRNPGRGLVRSAPVCARRSVPIDCPSPRAPLTLDYGAVRLRPRAKTSTTTLDAMRCTSSAARAASSGVAAKPRKTSRPLASMSPSRT